LHITRFFSEYWPCYPLIFASEERLICSNTDSISQHGFDRYGPYKDAVLSAPNPGFLYPEGSSTLADLLHILTKTHTPYHATICAGYVIIQPAHRIPSLLLYQ
jgi:hypothetical protein